VFGWFADTYGNFSTGMIVYGIVGLVGTAMLLPIKPRFWTSPGKHDTSRKHAARRTATAAG
jgi:hypothetical protein